MNAFKCEVVVGKNGRIEVPVSDLPEGVTIEAIFVIKPNAIGLESSDRDEVLVTKNEIVSKEISPNVMTWEELSQRIDAAGEDPEQPSLQEISEIVKELRKSRRAA
jgi:exosome complex RNA-binding protein Rrp4